MKILFVILLSLLLAEDVYSSKLQTQTVHVTGTGSNAEQAKNDAFRKAIEFSVGAILVNNIEVRNNKLTLDEILSYSSGYVENYKIHNTTYLDNKVSVDMTVTVSSSKIANRMLSASTEGTMIDGGKFAVQKDTFLQSKNNSDAVLNNFFNSYPSKAYEINNVKTSLKTNDVRKITLSVEFDLQWNQNWLNAFREIITLVDSDVPPKKSSFIILFNDDPKAFLEKNRWVAGHLEDHQTIDLIIRSFITKEPMIKVELFDNNVSLNKQCFSPSMNSYVNPQTTYYGVSAIKLFPKRIESFRLNLNIPVTLNKVSDMKITLVEESKCN